MDAAGEARRIIFTAEGPALVEGPVELVTATGAVLRGDRFLVAICLCKRSGSYPLCDTSHRRGPRRSGGSR
ncbi:CDGSH iron-sulfur domain-containing protein [Nocardia sp. NBC_00416]